MAELHQGVAMAKSSIVRAVRTRSYSAPPSSTSIRSRSTGLDDLVTAIAV